LAVAISRSARRSSVFGAAGVLLLMAGCSGANSANVSQTNYVTGKGVQTLYQLGHRKAAPVIAGTDLTGASLSTSSYAGKVIVLNFWASWCPPCRAEAKALEQVYTDTRSAGVQFLGDDIRENGISDGVNFEVAQGVTYPSLSDQAGRNALAFRASGAIPEIPPSTLIIDRHGDVAVRILGETDYNQLMAAVRSVASEP
jgi:thiol-disulfide isomerase/thioredoxin